MIAIFATLFTKQELMLHEYVVLYNYGACLQLQRTY